MPHDATLYAEGVKQRLTPAETADRVNDEVEDARAEYKEGAQSTAEQYRYLTTGVAADQTPVLESFTPDGLPAGGIATVITVHGSHFVASSKVNWDGALVTTTYVNPTTLTISITPPPAAKGVPVFVVNGDLHSKTKNCHFVAAAEDAPSVSKAKAAPKPKAAKPKTE